MPKPPESRMKKAAKKFGKFLGTAALATAISVSPFSVSFPKSVFQDKKIEFVRGAHAEEIIEPVSEIVNAIDNTKRFIKNGKMNEVIFNTETKEGSYRVSIAEWRITYDRGGPGNLYSSGVVGNKFNRNTSGSWITTPIYDLSRKENKVDYEYVKGYAVQRPDDSSQTVLVLACKDYLNFYVLNKQNEIEWISIAIKNVGIERKPELLLIAQDTNTKTGKGMIFLVMDEEAYKKIINQTATQGETAKTLIALVVPKPDIPGKSAINYSGSAGLATVALR